jgi:NADH-quinone oxidoreductase subunit L
VNFEVVLIGVIFLPAVIFAGLGLSWLVGWAPRERPITRLTACCYLLETAAAVWLSVNWIRRGMHRITVSIGDWFEVSHYRFPLTLTIDGLSLPLLCLSVVLLGLIGSFSARYLHRDPGFFRFFLLLHLFGFGVLLLFGAGSFDLLIFGWELVGFTSVLLIAYFQFRDDPVRSGLRVFATYRACDVGLLTAVALLHHFAGSAAYEALFSGSWPGPGLAMPLGGGAATTLGLLFLWAAMGKSAQVPFSGWMPRAMEGPTPSSAIFYGALSVHAGVYLLLRAQPILAASRWTTGAVIAIGVLTAIHGTLVGRAAPDAKTALAYAAITQLGLIFVEIGLGYPRLALLHTIGHALTRTLQFLRAPSMLHDHHRMHAAAGGHLAETGRLYNRLLPGPLQHWLYRLAIDRGHHDAAIDRFAMAPLLKAAGRLQMLETQLLARSDGTPQPRRRRLAASAGLPALRQKTESADA